MKSRGDRVPLDETTGIVHVLTRHLTQGHVNNVNYYRYAESARVNWITNFSVHVDPAHSKEWAELMQPKAIGLIMKSLKCDFKFVSFASPLLPIPTAPPPLPEMKDAN